MSGRHTDPWYDSASISASNIVTGKRKRVPVRQLDPGPHRWERLPEAPHVEIPLIPDVKASFPYASYLPPTKQLTRVSRGQVQYLLRALTRSVLERKPPVRGSRRLSAESVLSFP